MPRTTARRRLRSAALLLALGAGAIGLPSRLVADNPPPKAGGEEGSSAFGAILDPIDPGRLHRLLDRAVGLDPGDRSRRPEAPEIGEPVFFDVTRPLGDRKYATEFNYLFNSSTGNAPTLQVLEFEYTFADWKAAEVDLSYFNGNLEILTPFYQRTLGVGRRGNWVHGYQVSPDVYLRSGFVGGSAVYTFGWKPEKESRFSALAFLGANRMLIGGFHPAPGSGRFPVAPGDRVYGSWRPTFNLDLFYKLNDRLSIGVENDLFFQSGRASEYLSFPFVTYEPGERFFLQVGGGYYHFESRDQFTFLLHLNFVDPSPRRPREAGGRREAGTSDPDPHRGPVRRCLGRLLGEH